MNKFYTFYLILAVSVIGRAQDSYLADLDASYLAKLPESNIYMVDSVMQLNKSNKLRAASPESFLEISGAYSKISEIPFSKAAYASGKILNPERKRIHNEDYTIFTMLLDGNNKAKATGKRIYFAIGSPNRQTNQIKIYLLDSEKNPEAVYLAHVAVENEVAQMYRKSNSSKKSSKIYDENL